MSRSIGSCFGVLVLLASSLVSFATASELTTPEELREAAYAGQVDRVDEALEYAQTEFEKGNLVADDVRELASVFATSKPDILTFLEDWLRAKPNSAFAHALKAQSLHDIGFTIRGERFAGDTYPDALRTFSYLHNQAWEHATKAYELNPRFIPTSDTILSLSYSLGRKSKAFKVLDEVMETDPNMGSVESALFLSASGWGGNYAQAKNICTSYAPLVTTFEDPLTYCKLYIWDNYYREELSGWAMDLLADSEDPNHAYFRMQLIFGAQKPISLEDGLFAQKYLLRDDIAWPKIAHVYDHLMAQRYGLPFLHEKHFYKTRERAQRFIEHDPFDPDLIDTLLSNLKGGGYHLDSSGHPYDSTIYLTSREEEQDLRLRLIKVQPYHYWHWTNFANFLRKERTYASARKAEPFMINAIVYSNHDVSQTEALLLQKLKQWNFAENAEHGVDYTFEKFTQEGIDRDILCPLIRIHRMHDHLCKQADADEKRYCSLPADVQPMIRHARRDALSRNVCEWEREVPTKKLEYLPVTINFDRLFGG